jgi:hypothetical protein
LHQGVKQPRIGRQRPKNVTRPNRSSNPENRQRKLPPFYQCAQYGVVYDELDTIKRGRYASTGKSAYV